MYRLGNDNFALDWLESVTLAWKQAGAAVANRVTTGPRPGCVGRRVRKISDLESVSGIETPLTDYQTPLVPVSPGRMPYLRTAVRA